MSRELVSRFAVVQSPLMWEKPPPHALAWLITTPIHTYGGPHTEPTMRVPMLSAFTPFCRRATAACLTVPLAFQVCLSPCAASCAPESVPSKPHIHPRRRRSPLMLSFSLFRVFVAPCSIPDAAYIVSPYPIFSAPSLPPSPSCHTPLSPMSWPALVFATTASTPSTALGRCRHALTSTTPSGR